MKNSIKGEMVVSIGRFQLFAWEMDGNGSSTFFGYFHP